MSLGVSWKLKRYGRFVPGKDKTEAWKVLEAKNNNPEIVLTFVECGYLMVVQGEEILDTISLACGPDSLRMQQKCDCLFFRIIVKGESRMMRVQFDGRSRAEAISECLKAAEKLKEYVAVITHGGAPPHPNQPPAEPPAPARQQTCQEEAAGAAGELQPEVAQGPLSIKRLVQHYLGETALTLPKEYRQTSLPEGGLEPILRVFLLDPSFGAFVEMVEGEMRKLLEQ